MSAVFYLLAALCWSASAAPQTPAHRFGPIHLPQQLLNPYEPRLDYYLDNPEVANYYNQEQQKQARNAGGGNIPMRLETLDPDSEVELIPGAQQPQQPPQQNPVAPGLPGLLPGQRVFIVHMPVPGISPGTIGGYQPLYIVAAAPQGNTGFTANGYQNPLYLDPSGQTVVPSYLAYSRPGLVAPGNPGYVLSQTPLLPRPFGYQEQPLIYQPLQSQGAEGGRLPVRFSQLIAIQGQQPQESPRATSSDGALVQEQHKSTGDNIEKSEKEADEQRLNARPAPSHTQTRKP